MSQEASESIIFQVLQGSYIRYLAHCLEASSSLIRGTSEPSHWCSLLRAEQRVYSSYLEVEDDTDAKARATSSSKYHATLRT